MTIDTYVISATGKATIKKDPDATLDYPFDFTDWLTDIGDTISAALVIPVAGILLDTVGHGPNGYSVSGMKVIAWLKGGTIDETYQVTCRVTTAAGRIDDRSIFVNIKDR